MNLYCKFTKNSQAKSGVLVYGGDSDWPRTDFQVLSFHSLHTLANDFR